MDFQHTTPVTGKLSLHQAIIAVPVYSCPANDLCIIIVKAPRHYSISHNQGKRMRRQIIRLSNKYYYLLVVELYFVIYQTHHQIGLPFKCNNISALYKKCLPWTPSMHVFHKFRFISLNPQLGVSQLSP